MVFSLGLSFAFDTCKHYWSPVVQPALCEQMACDPAVVPHAFTYFCTVSGLQVTVTIQATEEVTNAMYVPFVAHYAATFIWCDSNNSSD